jgi:hypothetical protein
MSIGDYLEYLKGERTKNITRSGNHVTVGPESPLDPNFNSTTESYQELILRETNLETLATAKKKLDTELRQVGPDYFSVTRTRSEGGLFCVCHSKYHLLGKNSGSDSQGAYHFFQLCEDLGSKNYVILDRRKFKIFYRSDNLKEAKEALDKPKKLFPLPENDGYSFQTRSL